MTFARPTTVVDDRSADRPAAFTLSQNCPNPFNPLTSITYSLPGEGDARLEVLNATGQLIDVLANGFHHAGAYTVSWQNNDCPTGIYLYRLKSGAFTKTKK